MTSQRWQQIRQLFHDALERPQDERAQFIRISCGDDEELQAEVISLLKAHDDATEFFESASGPSMLIDSMAREMDAPGSLEGSRVGAYRLTRELGRGGMGSVYLAVRDDHQYEKRVAVKLIRRGMDTDDVLRRFRSERQILASLDHPNIARLLDGGTTEDGRPYFIMEYVDGLPIDRYCDRHRLSIEARLRLFGKVCDAVQHAHQHLVVHRDLKPNNILVTSDGKVKLLDFGIAKLLAPDESHAGLTRLDMRIMTPEYAAPEQVAGGLISTATDVYALGAVLYQLLTGHRPYDLPSRLRNEVARVICEEMPARPSTVVTRAASSTGPVTGDAAQDLAPDDLSLLRGTTCQRLRRRLSGDLDNIVLTALKKEPERRYPSIEDFARDVSRHLSGKTVAARPDTLSYRAGKFVRRHKVGVAAASLFMALLLGSVVVIGLQNARISVERDKAEHISTFLVDLFEISDPSETRGNSITAREMLDRGLDRLDGDAGVDPEVHAAMLDVMGRVYHKLGLFGTAEELLRRAVAERRRIFPGPNGELAESISHLGAVLRDQGQYDEAENLHREALALREKLDGAAAPSAARSLNNLALVLIEKSDYTAAEALLRQALALKQKHSGRESLEMAMSLYNLAFLLKERGEYDEAETMYREVLSIRRKLLEEDHPEMISTLNNLAALLHRQGRFGETETLQREVLRLRRKLHGEEHPDVATALNNLSTLLKDLGRLDEAEALCRQALEIQERLLGEAHPRSTITLYNLALIQHAAGRLDAAEPTYRRSLELHRTIWPNHPYVAFPLTALGQLLIERGETREAERLLREALRLRRENLTPDAWLTALSESALGAALTAEGRYAEAESLLVTSTGILERERSAEDRHTQAAYRHLADLYEATGRTEEATAIEERISR